MFILYKICVFLHVFSAIFWIGGMAYTALVLVPTFRDRVLNSVRGHFFAVMGKRFSNISWFLFLLIIATGSFQLWYKWLGQDVSLLFNAEWWDSSFGITFATKLIAFGMVLLISGLHDFWLGPTATKLIDVSPTAKKTTQYRKITSWVGRLNFLLGLIILYLAISLVRG